MNDKNKILIGGRALSALGSARLTTDIDYLVNDKNTTEKFIRDEKQNIDYINANGHNFYKEIWEREKGREMASPQALLEMKAFSFVQHCINGFFQKADDAEYDIKFLVRRFDLEGLKIVTKYLSAGELSEVEKIIKSVRK